MRGTYTHVRCRVLRNELRDGRVREDPSAPDDEQVVGGERHLGHEVAGHEDRPALAREVLHEIADPQDALGVEAVDGLVEEQHARVAQQGACDAEPLTHAEREPADTLRRNLAQADHLDDLVDAAAWDAVALGEPEQVVVGGTAAVHGLRVEQCADLAQRRGHVDVRLAVDGHSARGGTVQAEHHAHRRRLSGAVGSEEPGHPTSRDREVDPVDCGLLAVPLRQLFRCDHREDFPHLSLLRRLRRYGETRPDSAVLRAFPGQGSGRDQG